MTDSQFQQLKAEIQKSREMLEESRILASDVRKVLDAWAGFQKVIYTLGRYVFLFGVLWAIFGEKVMAAIGG